MIPNDKIDCIQDVHIHFFVAINKILLSSSTLEKYPKWV